MVDRVAPLERWLARKSFFLLGPRQTGKSTLLREKLPGATYIDLLHTDVARLFQAHPERLREQAPLFRDTVVIDEIQKVPALLDEVQSLLDRNRSLRFVLTGSSARKLRRGQVNLLGGRAHTRRLFPFVSAELGYDGWESRLHTGSLPGVYAAEDAFEDLEMYVGSYLREEIAAEGLARSVGSFSRFLEIAALSNAEQINYSKIASDAGLPASTVREYFQILEDTLIAHRLPSTKEAKGRKVVARPKFYFVDVGLVHALLGVRKLNPHTAAYGKALEQLIFSELQAYLSYRGRPEVLSYWRTHTQQEVDFCVGSDLAIEVKASTNLSRRDFRSLMALKEDLPTRRSIVVCRENQPRVHESGVEIMPVSYFLEALWGDELFL